jgi:hypothetical protein
MTGILNLEKMLPQLQRAYLAAVQLADEQEAHRLRSYFREDGTPYVQTVCVPDPRDAGTWQKVNVPLYALIPASSFQIKEMTVEFEGWLEGLTGFEVSSPDVSETPQKKSRSRRRKARSETAQVRITLKSSPAGTDGGESGVSTRGTKVGVDVTIVYPGETLHSYRIFG